MEKTTLFSTVARWLAAAMVMGMTWSLSVPLDAADLPVTSRRSAGEGAGHQDAATAPDVLWRRAFQEWDSLQRYGQEGDFCLFLERYYLFPDWVERAAERLSFRAEVEGAGLNRFRVGVEGGCAKEPLVAFEPAGKVLSFHWESGAYWVQVRSDAVVTMTLRSAWGAATSVRLDATYQEISAEISIDNEQQLLRIENIRGGKPGLPHVLRIEEGDRFIDTVEIGHGNNYLSVSRLAPLKPGREYRFRIGDSRHTFFSEAVELRVPAGAGRVSQSWLLAALFLAGCNLLTVFYYEVLKKS